MVDENLDTTEVDAAQESVVDDDQESQEKAKPFTPEQEAYIGSWMGRVIAKQFDEKVLPIVGDRLPQPAQPDQPGILEKFNEDISAEFFTNPYNAFKKMMDVYQGTQTTLSKNQKTQTDKMLLKYSDQPYYKDIFSSMQKTAHEAVGQGYPPEAATEYAYQRAKSDYLEKQLRGTTDDLDLLEGGIPNKQKKKIKLPPQFQAAYERDKAAGIFKNEEEYINSLAPQLRNQLGI